MLRLALYLVFRKINRSKENVVKIRSLLGVSVVTLSMLFAQQASAVPLGEEETYGGTVESFSHELTPGSGETVGSVWSEGGDFQNAMPSNARWGASYALSTEMFQFFYEGRALAAGNIYNGQRITQVCMLYKRGGAAISATVCSDARSDGRNWHPGPISTLSVRDTIVSNAPKTEFHYYYHAVNSSIV